MTEQPPYGQPQDPQQPYGQQPYGQQPYGQQPPNAYGQPVYGYQQAPDHPRSTVILVLGILSVVACQIIGPVAWVMGNSAIKEIDASQGRLGGRSAVQAGRICGIVATVILILALLAMLTLLVLAVATTESFNDGSTNY